MLYDPYSSSLKTYHTRSIYKVIKQSTSQKLSRLFNRIPVDTIHVQVPCKWCQNYKLRIPVFFLKVVLIINQNFENFLNKQMNCLLKQCVSQIQEIRNLILELSIYLVYARGPWQVNLHDHCCLPRSCICVDMIISTIFSYDSCGSMQYIINWINSHQEICLLKYF